MSKLANKKQSVKTHRSQPVAERQKIRSTSEPSKSTGLICQGWISLAAWIVFGLLIEGLIGFRSPPLLDDSVRREMFRLAHAHGTLLNLVLIAAAICARLDLIGLGRATSLGLRTAVVLLPIGFFLAGLWHFKDDPGIAIFLVPLGAVLLLMSAFQIGYSVFRR
jgi:hypothetical protein